MLKTFVSSRFALSIPKCLWEETGKYFIVEAFLSLGFIATCPNGSLCF